MKLDKFSENRKKDFKISRRCFILEQGVKKG